MENQTPEENIIPAPEISFDERYANAITNGYKIEIGKFISEGKKLFYEKGGSFVGFILLLLAITSSAFFIPVSSPLIYVVFGAPLEAGFLILAHRIYHKLPFEFGDFFLGYKILKQFALLSLTLWVIAEIINIPYEIFVIDRSASETFNGLIISHSPVWYHHLHPAPTHGSFKWYYIFEPLLTMSVNSIITIFFFFSKFILLFGKKNFWEAISYSAKIVSKKYFHFLLFSFSLDLIIIGGVLALIIGVLWTAPIAICASYIAYERIIGTNPHDSFLQSEIENSHSAIS